MENSGLESTMLLEHTRS